MSVYDITPALRPYVKLISSIENNGAENALPVLRILPDTCVELFLTYSNQPLATIAGKTIFGNARSFVVFRMSAFMDVQMYNGTGCIAVCFHPGAAHHFFSIPMNELADTATPLEDVWKPLAKEMEERIGGCSSNTERVSLLQDYLLGLLQKGYNTDTEFDYCLWQIGLLKGQLRIKDLSKKINISQRQLGRQFSVRMGISPKEYARINRFMAAVGNLKRFPSHSLTEIGYESGYYDQAHFIHDCRSFTGLTPSELISRPCIIY